MTTTAGQARTELSDTEREQLVAHEGVIERGLNTFVEVGAALVAIRNGRLYRTDYDSFGEYCDDRWSISRRYADYMIAAADIAMNLRTIGLIRPENEAQVRPLVGLQPVAQGDAWKRAWELAEAEQLPSPRARHVEQAVHEVTRDQKSRAVLAALPYADSSSGAGKKAADDLIRLGLIEESDLTGLSAEAWTTLVWEASRADEETSIEWRDEHPQALVPKRQPLRFGRAVLRRYVREAAARLRAGTIGLGSVRALVRVDQQLESESHVNACQALEKSLASLARRVKRGCWHDASALVALRRRHESIRKALDSFMVDAVRMETALALPLALRAARAEPGVPER